MSLKATKRVKYPKLEQKMLDNVLIRDYYKYKVPNRNKGGANLREILKQERIKKGLTQQALANLVGISRVHYTQIENNSGNKKPSLDVAIGIKKVLGYSGDDLFSVGSVPDKNHLL